MQGKAILQQLTAYKQGMQIKDVKAKYNLSEIVKLASNENPYGYSPRVKEAMASHTFDFEIYPDGYAADLRHAVAEKYNIDGDQIVFGAGSDELISLICRAFLYEGTNTVMATPTFPQYRHNALIEGATLKEIPTLANGKHDLTAMLAAIDQHTKVVWLCSPDNPTGTLLTREELTQFMQQCPKDVVVVLDEAYYEYVAESDRLPLEETIFTYDNMIVLRTFSKIYGLAALRVGYALTSRDIAQQLNVVRGPFNVSALAQQLAKIALTDQEFVAETQAKNAHVREEFTSFLRSLGWDYYDSHTNFILVKTPIDADVASEYLLKHGFIVRSGNLLGYPKTLRITLGKQEDMRKLYEVMAELQKEINDGVFA